MKRPYDFEFGENAVSVLGNISQAYMWPRILAVENSIVEEIIRLTGSLSRKRLPCGHTSGTLNLPSTMSPRGKLITLEGIDGSGKQTQLKLLASALESRGVPALQVGFPRYETFFGKLVGQYLNGDFGPLKSVDPHFSALLYAGNRFEAKNELEEALAAGKIVLADRYIGSNLAHQTARMPPAQRAKFIVWLKQLEYGIYGLPVEDLVVYLHVPTAEAHRLVGRKSARSYTTLKRDIQEADISHLEKAALIYEELATEQNWVRVECANAASGTLDPPEQIHRSVLLAVEEGVLSRNAGL
jgi:dTMP kinase